MTAPAGGRGDLVLPREISLRPVTDEDRELLFAVYSSTRADELALVAWSDDQKSQFLRHQFQAQDLEYRRAYPDGEFAVIELSGEPVGRLYLRRGASDTRIVDLAILPEFRGRGVGGRLLGDLAREADAAARTLSIHVEALNSGARRLYERFGFELAEDKGVYLLLTRRPRTPGG
jgi:ribosomal protein S18 acetylase RimI-like enzyme